MIKDYHALLQESRYLYENTKPPHCPYFGREVALTSDGFNHLLNRPTREPRTIKEKQLKLRCLKAALSILQRAGTVQEYRSGVEKVGSHSKNVEYWAFHDIVGTNKKFLIKVVVRKVGGGQPHFWSTMPRGKIGKSRLYRPGIETD